jgi:hypothetical protein
MRLAKEGWFSGALSRYWGMDDQRKELRYGSTDSLAPGFGESWGREPYGLPLFEGLNPQLKENPGDCIVGRVFGKILRAIHPKRVSHALYEQAVDVRLGIPYPSKRAALIILRPQRPQDVSKFLLIFPEGFLMQAFHARWSGELLLILQVEEPSQLTI